MAHFPPFMVAGSALWDIIATAERPMKPGFDLPGRIQRQMGGVALNVALATARLDRPVGLLSAIGRDAEGDMLLAEAATNGVDCTHVSRSDDPTDAYLAVENPDGEVFSAIADCAALELAGDRILAPLSKAPFTGTLVIDGNLPTDLLNCLPDLPALASATCAYVPASPGKAERLRGVLARGKAAIYVNLIEARILLDRDIATAHQAAAALFDAGAALAVVTDGPRQAASADDQGRYAITPPTVEARTTTGAGDVFLANHLTAIADGLPHEDALARAVDGATRHICAEAQ